MNTVIRAVTLVTSLVFLILSHSLWASTVVPTDKFGVIEKIPSEVSPHWLWVYDPNFISFGDGRAHLIDGDTGRYMGTLNTGYVHLHLTLPTHYKEIYSAETYFSRHYSGTRTDVVRVYDPENLVPLAEIEIPAKRGTVFPRKNNAALTEDNKFMAIFNFTPATSLTVVDTNERKFIADIDTPGCSLVLSGGGYRFLSICSDGTALKFNLAADGKDATKVKSSAFFDMKKDPITEDPVRYKNQWLFASIGSMIYSIDFSKEQLTFPKPWSLLNDAERKDGWRAGGAQQLAINEQLGLLYSVMHQGPVDTYEHGGPEVWVYDIEKQKRIKQIRTKRKAISIHVSPDKKPLMFSLTDEEATLDIYNAITGEHLREVDELGVTPWSMETPPYKN